MLSGLTEQSTSSTTQNHSKALEMSSSHTVHAIASGARAVALSIALPAADLGARTIVLLGIR